MRSDGRLVAIGEITRPHGLRGEVKVVPLTDRPERFARLADCVLWDAGRDARQACRIERARRQGNAVIVALTGCETVEAARALVGRLLAVPESEVLPPPPGHFYPWQLVGARVLTEDGREVGRLARIDQSPAHDLWVVEAGGREVLVPAVGEIVVDVDVAGGRVTIRPPEGLLEL